MAGRLPVPLTEFIGRRQERAEVAELLARARLVTLVGRAGWARPAWRWRWRPAWRHGFADGVDFVDLAPVGDAASVPAMVARGLELEEWGEPPSRTAWPGCCAPSDG